LTVSAWPGRCSGKRPQPGHRPASRCTRARGPTAPECTSGSIRHRRCRSACPTAASSALIDQGLGAAGCSARPGRGAHVSIVIGVAGVEVNAVIIDPGREHFQGPCDPNRTARSRHRKSSGCSGRSTSCLGCFERDLDVVLSTLGPQCQNPYISLPRPPVT